MSAPQLTGAQQRAVQLLKDNTLYPNLLLRNCLLDYGRHELLPTTSLGDLSSLPTELLDEVIGYVDLASLMVFRRVNQ
jgi:hypothetical protein